VKARKGKEGNEKGLRSGEDGFISERSCQGLGVVYLNRGYELQSVYSTRDRRKRRRLQLGMLLGGIWGDRGGTEEGAWEGIGSVKNREKSEFSSSAGRGKQDTRK